MTVTKCVVQSVCSYSEEDHPMSNVTANIRCLSKIGVIGQLILYHNEGIHKWCTAVKVFIKCIPQ